MMNLCFVFIVFQFYTEGVFERWFEHLSFCLYFEKTELPRFDYPKRGSRVLFTQSL